MAELKLGYEKALRLLELTQRKLYCEEARTLTLRAKLDSLKTSLALIYPNCFKYIVDQERIHVELAMRKEQLLAGASLDNRDRLYFSDDERSEDPGADIPMTVAIIEEDNGRVSSKEVEKQ